MNNSRDFLICFFIIFFLCFFYVCNFEFSIFFTKIYEFIYQNYRQGTLIVSLKSCIYNNRGPLSFFLGIVIYILLNYHRDMGSKLTYRRRRSKKFYRKLRRKTFK